MTYLYVIPLLGFLLESSGVWKPLQMPDCELRSPQLPPLVKRLPKGICSNRVIYYRALTRSLVSHSPAPVSALRQDEWEEEFN